MTLQLHFILDQEKKSNKFVITAYEYPHYILLTNYPTGSTSLQTLQIRTKIFNFYLGKGMIELSPHKPLQKYKKIPWSSKYCNGENYTSPKQPGWDIPASYTGFPVIYGGRAVVL